MKKDIQAGWVPAPLIAEYRNGNLSLRDGNHRQGALIEAGFAKYPTIIWFNSEEDMNKWNAIRPYSSEWPEKFKKEAALIKENLGGLALAIEHIGSTSIPGLSAKPIIDIAVLAESIQDAAAFAASLEKIGYRYKPDMSSVERVFLRKGHPAEYHLSITESRYSYWTRQMLFRNYLRNHPEAVKEYMEIKSDLAGKIPGEDFKDLSRSKLYNMGKTAFVEKILRLASEK